MIALYHLFYAASVLLHGKQLKTAVLRDIAVFDVYSVLSIQLSCQNAAWKTIFVLRLKTHGIFHLFKYTKMINDGILADDTFNTV
jgi:hypothetical protein